MERRPSQHSDLQRFLADMQEERAAERLRVEKMQAETVGFDFETGTERITKVPPQQVLSFPRPPSEREPTLLLTETVGATPQEHLRQRQSPAPAHAPAPQTPPRQQPTKAPRQELPRELRGSWLSFFLRSAAFLMLLGAIWAPTYLYTKYAPQIFESRWRIILPGEGIKTGLRLDEIGEARTSAKSVFSSKDFDPRATYREIAASEIVRSAAADARDVPNADFAGPKIKEIPQTAILEFRIRRGSPEIARSHAIAYMQSFDARVDELRKAELRSRQGVARRNISALETQLRDKRDEKLQRQRLGGLVSPDQFDALVANADDLRTQLTTEEIELQEIEDRFSALASAIGVTPQIASWALTLKADRMFQSMASAYVEAQTELSRLRGNLGARHPTLISTRVRRDELYNDVKQRSELLIGRAPPELAVIMDLTESPERSALFASIVESNSVLQGKRARVAALRAAVNRSDGRIPALAEQAAQLSAISRETQVAEAVYASALASVDLSQTDPYASYPLYQTLDAPSLPSKPVGPKKKEALAGAVAATLLLVLAFLAIWYRKRLRRARLRRAMSSGPSA